MNKNKKARTSSSKRQKTNHRKESFWTKLANMMITLCLTAGMLWGLQAFSRTGSTNLKFAQVSDVLAYKKTNSEERTSVIYACTSWGLHQSFVIYNFKDYVPDAGI